MGMHRAKPPGGRRKAANSGLHRRPIGGHCSNPGRSMGSITSSIPCGIPAPPSRFSMSNPLPPNRALQKIRSGGVVSVYVTGNFASARHIDFVGRSGRFDAIWLDLEHFDIPTQELATLCLVANAHPITTVARLKATDYQVVMRTLEAGVGGLMCSM